MRALSHPAASALISKRVGPLLQGEGTLQPFEQKALTVRYHPPAIELKKGFKAELLGNGEHKEELANKMKLNDELKCQLKEANKREDHEVEGRFSGTCISSSEEIATMVRLVGRAVAPEVSLSHFEIEFIGKQTLSVGTKRWCTLTLNLCRYADKRAHGAHGQNPKPQRRVADHV